MPKKTRRDIVQNSKVNPWPYISIVAIVLIVAVFCYLLSYKPRPVVSYDVVEQNLGGKAGFQQFDAIIPRSCIEAGGVGCTSQIDDFEDPIIHGDLWCLQNFGENYKCVKCRRGFFWNSREKSCMK